MLKSSQDRVTTNNIMVSLRTFTHIDKQTFCAVTHPQTRMQPAATYPMTPTRKPMPRLMQPVFLEILATKHPDRVPTQLLNSSSWQGAWINI